MSKVKEVQDKKPLQAVGRFSDLSFNRKGDKKRSERYYIIVPPELLHDDRFPLHLNEPVMCRVEGQKLIVVRMVPQE